jgi:nucleotide-binding universal stress UspA family protein
MFDRILVPLDGSRMAESALPAAEAVRRAFGSAVTLIHVLESGVTQVHGERHLHGPEEAEAYLADTAKRYFPPEVNVNHHVHIEEKPRVPESLTEHSLELGQDLIVMCVHGRGGIERFVEGSIAQRILERQAVPVLLVRPEAEDPFAPMFRLIVVPLDGKPGHEQSLPVAADMASHTGSRVLLLTVVPTWYTLMGERKATGRLLPGATAEFLMQTEESAGRYLEERSAPLAARGVKVDTEIRRGKAPGQIARVARRAGADLIVL